MMKIDLKRFMNIKYLIVAIISLFVVLVAVQSSKKFVLDELDFPILSEVISEHYAPIYYRGEADPENMGIYHPTLYANALGVFIKIFGFSEITVRMFGLLCVFLVFVLSIKIIMRLYPQGDKGTAVAVFGLLFLLNPYTVANVTLPDIDQTVLPLVLLIHIYLCLVVSDSINNSKLINKTVLILSLSFALALWAKLTLTLILPIISLMIFLLRKNSVMQSVRTVILYSFIGGGVFISTYYIYCSVFNLPVMYTFNFLISSLSSKSAANGLYKTIHHMLSNFRSIALLFNWIGLPCLVVMAMSVIGIMKDLTVARINKILVIGMFSVFWMITFMYSLITTPFGGFFKYPYPLYQFAFFPAVMLLMNREVKLTNLNILMVMLCAIISFTCESLFLSDTHFLENYDASIAVVISVTAALCISMIMSKYFMRYFKTVLMCFVGMAAGFNLSIVLIQAKAGYSTKYEYGQMGMGQTIEYLRSHTSKDEIIWSMKDVGYYVNNHYIENYAYFADNDKIMKIPEIIESKKIRYFVVTKGIGRDNIEDNAHIKDILDKYCVIEKEYGNYIIYRSRSSL